MGKKTRKEEIRVSTRRIRSSSNEIQQSLTSRGSKRRRTDLKTKAYAPEIQQHQQEQLFVEEKVFIDRQEATETIHECGEEYDEQVPNCDVESFNGDSHSSSNQSSHTSNTLKVYSRRPRGKVVPFFRKMRTKNFKFMQRSKSTTTEVKGSLKKNIAKKITPSREQGVSIDLDEDTIKEWERLMGKSKNEDDEEAEKSKEKWEKERELFRGRIASFISRMHLIQGNRRFSPWKGSVVDSVAGVFLTQNVSDYISSSAFLSLIARYPNGDIGGIKSSVKNFPESSTVKFVEEVTHSTIVEERKLSLIMSAKQKDRILASLSTSKKGVKMKKTLVKVELIDECSNAAKTEEKGLENNFLTRKTDKELNGSFNRDNIRKLSAYLDDKMRSETTLDAVDWNAVSSADVNEVSKAIAERGMEKKLAERIKNCLKLLNKELGNIDLEWLRNVPPQKARDYLMSIYGLGLKSVECIRLLALKHQAFPVDTNVGRILIRLGWVPLRSLPKDQPMHLLKKFPRVVNSIHKYLWPRLCTLDYLTLYEFHHQMITFGKVFCTQVKPNCNACPMIAECKYYASAFTSESLTQPDDDDVPLVDHSLNTECDSLEPEISSSVYPMLDRVESSERDMEDLFLDEIPTITFDCEKLVENLLNYVEDDLDNMSKAPSTPLPKWKIISRLRTEHQVYELPDSHPLLLGLDKRERGDPCPYLLAIKEPEDLSKPLEEDNTTIQGTLLIPCRTATKGRFPLNGTYFQVNEVFVDYESSKCPIDVPRAWLWNLRVTTLYCGTSIKTIFRGMTTEDVQRCFWTGYVCLRGFNRKTRQPMSLPPEMHLPGKARRQQPTQDRKK